MGVGVGVGTVWSWGVGRGGILVCCFGDRVQVVSVWDFVSGCWFFSFFAVGRMDMCGEGEGVSYGMGTGGVGCVVCVCYSACMHDWGGIDICGRWHVDIMYHSKRSKWSIPGLPSGFRMIWRLMRLTGRLERRLMRPGKSGLFARNGLGCWDLTGVREGWLPCWRVSGGGVCSLFLWRRRIDIELEDGWMDG